MIVVRAAHAALNLLRVLLNRSRRPFFLVAATTAVVTVRFVA